MTNLWKLQIQIKNSISWLNATLKGLKGDKSLHKYYAYNIENAIPGVMKQRCELKLQKLASQMLPEFDFNS